tara:strand:- start:11975 stop:12142 length:168 start_codon:yes stop_codon:yes gene_type:complete
MKVKATQTGFYGGQLRPEGAVFNIRVKKDFSKKWMAEAVEAEQVEKDADDDQQED